MPRLVPDDSLRASPTDLETRALSAVIRSGRLGTLFMTALRRANQLLDAALLLQVAELRRAGDPVERAHARAKELELQLSFAFQTIDVLLERLGRVPPAHRPRYRNADRGRILHHKEAFQLSCREVARLYALTSSTVHRWVVDCVAPKRPERPLVAPAPPDRSYSALVRQQVVNLSMAGFGGSLRLAQTLAREGLLLSRSTVRRWTKETAPESPRADEADAKPASGTAAAGSAAQGTPSIVEPAVRARRPNHVPLAWRLFTTEPSAAEMAAVLDEAVARARRFHADVSLAHFVTDKGACFTAEEFQTAVARNGMKARYGAVGRHGSIALIERLYLKDLLLLRLDSCLLIEDLERRVGLGLFYYSVVKPHQGLGGATPAEVYFGKEPSRGEAGVVFAGSGAVGRCPAFAPPTPRFSSSPAFSEPSRSPLD